MPKGIKQCKICGREYEYCRSMLPDTGIFRWQDVACCQEHGTQYFRLVLEARGESLPEELMPSDGEAPKKKTRKKKSVPAEPAADKEMA